MLWRCYMRFSLWLIILFLLCSNLITFAITLPTHRLYECQSITNRGYWLDVYIVTYTPVNYTVYRNKQLIGYTRLQPIYGLKRGAQMNEEEFNEQCR